MYAQSQSSMPSMPGMDHSQMPGMNHAAALSPAETLLMNQVSGTSMAPPAWPMPMLMKNAGSWRLMFMATAFLVDTQQAGPRGHDKFYSTNWAMVNAAHKAGRGALSFELMTSLEPLTITQRRYPELLQTGETAYGKPIVDAQHPHDLIMALAMHYAVPLSETTLFQAYIAPVGDPAFGPVAFPHRASASELPQAPLGHHWQDSTHIANEVITVGVKHNWLRLEASGFHGAEPNENRWNIDYGAIDSWSARVSVFPAKNWTAQVSAGRLAHPERQANGDVVRATASLSYSKPMPGGSWSSSLIWGRNHNTASRLDSNSYLVESELPVTRRDFLTGRLELVDKDELLPDSAASFRIGAATAGYTRDVDLLPHLESGIGFNVTAYHLPAALQSTYGNRPLALSVYLRLRLKAER
jgi:hypothetical protein